MKKMFTLLIALAIIFTCAQCYAAASKPVYDYNDKIFVEDFNAMAKAMTFSVIDTKIKTASDGTKELGDKDLTIKLTLNSAGVVQKIWLSSTNKDRLAEAFVVTLAIIGFNDKEFEALPLNKKENRISIWCESAKRQIIAEKAVTQNTFEVFIEAENKS